VTWLILIDWRTHFFWTAGYTKRWEVNPRFPKWTSPDGLRVTQGRLNHNQLVIYPLFATVPHATIDVGHSECWPMGSLQKRPGLIQIGRIEIDQSGQAVIIVESHEPVTKRDQPVFPQLTQYPIDVYGTQPRRIGQVGLR